jgi:hypothetical protein
MVNRFLSNLGIRLDNFGAKSLKLQTPNRCMVGPGGLKPSTMQIIAIESERAFLPLCFLSQHLPAPCAFFETERAACLAKKIQFKNFN